VKVVREIVLVDSNRHPGTEKVLDEIRDAGVGTTWPLCAPGFATC
jgi:hypothetical protein